MTFFGLLTYYICAIWTFAYMTDMLVDSLRLPPLEQLHPMQSFHAYQYWPGKLSTYDINSIGLYMLGAYSNYKKNNLFTALIFLAILSMMGRINITIGLVSHLLWYIFVGVGIASVSMATQFKVNLAAPKLFNLLVEMNSGEGIMNVN